MERATFLSLYNALLLSHAKIEGQISLVSLPPLALRAGSIKSRTLNESWLYISSVVSVAEKTEREVSYT